MRHLAARFVDLGHGQNDSIIAVHVVDPNLDFREKCDHDKKIVDDLRKRGLTDFDVPRIIKEYMEWWTIFKRFSCNRDVSNI